MERAFKFLKSTSVNDGAAVVPVAAGDGVAADDNAGGALSDDDLGEAAASGTEAGDVFGSSRGDGSSCAGNAAVSKNKIESVRMSGIKRDSTIMERKLSEELRICRACSASSIIRVALTRPSYLPTFLVPLIIVSHVLIFVRLARRDTI